MMLKRCSTLASMLTRKAWDLATGDYGFAEIEDTSTQALEKLAAELEMDVAKFLGAGTFEYDTEWTRHDYDNEVVREVRFYKGQKLVHKANKLYDNYYLLKLAEEKLEWSTEIQGKRVTKKDC